MRDLLTALGWSHIETVDDDLGQSATGGVTRAGFDRMVAEVCLGKVGAVAAREVSHFACNNRDWQQLIEMYRVVDTVLIDQETVHTPRQGTASGHNRETGVVVAMDTLTGIAAISRADTTFAGGIAGTNGFSGTWRRLLRRVRAGSRRYVPRHASG